MTAKILVADDSLTIQKVVSITLANNPYKITECLSEEKLFEEIKSSKYELILLDYNLSNAKSGSELAKEIKVISPDSSIMIMLGTFDSLDESSLKSSGIDDKIVKPFESSKFIVKCQNLIDKATSFNSPTTATTAEEEVEEIEPLSLDDDLDHWKVDNKTIEVEEVSFEEELVEDQNSFEEQSSVLDNEISGWGMQIPIIGKQASVESLFPPRIVTEVSPVAEMAMPASEDLEYPDVLEVEDIGIEDMGLSSRLVSVEELMPEDHSAPSISEDITDPSFQLDEVKDSPNLEQELHSEMNPEDFWAVDENAIEQGIGGAGANPTIAKEVEEKILELEDFDSNIELEISIPKNDVQQPSPVDQDEMIKRIEQSLRPMIEELVKEFCKERIEQVAWEVIPDLAENLIRKEITDISKRL